MSSLELLNLARTETALTPVFKLPDEMDLPRTRHAVVPRRNELLHV